MSDKQKKLFDYLYYAFLIITTVNLFLRTVIVSFTNDYFVLEVIQYILQFTVIAKIALEWKTKWSNKDILMCVCTAGILLAGACKYSNEDAFAYAFLIMGAKDIDRKKILKIFFAVTFVMYFATIGACLIGLIPNAVTYRSVDSTHARMALGFIYTTALSAHFLTLVVCWVLIREKKISILEIVIIGVSSGVIYYLTEARIASVSIFLIFIGLCVAKICYVKNVEFKLIRAAIVKWALILSSGILMVVSILVGLFYQYDNAVWAKINDMLSQRPISNAITFHRYPISLLGEHIAIHSQIHDGMNELPEYYYIINCSYIDVLFTMGILGAGAVLYIWIKLSHREAKLNNYMNLYMMAVLACFFFFEQRLFDFVYNPLLVLLFADYGKVEDFEKYDIQIFNKYKDGNRILRSVLIGLVVAFAVEGIVFNYQAVSTFLYEGTTIDSADIYVDGLKDNFDNDMYEYTSLDPMLILSNLKTYGDFESIFSDISFRTKDDHWHYRQVDNVPYSIDYYYSYAADENYDLLGTIEIDSSKRSTGYVKTPIIKGGRHNLLLQFHFPDDYYLDIFALEFNGAKPFDINYLRFLVMAIIVSIIYLVFSRKLDQTIVGEGNINNEAEC